MAGAVVTIQDDELRALCSRLNKMALTPGERKQLLGEIGTEMVSQSQERFVTKTTPDDDDWKDISDATKAFYKKKFGSDDPGNQGTLHRSGMLLASLTREADSWKVLVGATMEYAALHQFGGKVYPFGNKHAAKVDVPPRPYLGLGEEDKADVVWIINDFIAEKMQ